MPIPLFHKKIYCLMPIEENIMKHTLSKTFPALLSTLPYIDTMQILTRMNVYPSFSQKSKKKKTHKKHRIKKI